MQIYPQGAVRAHSLSSRTPSFVSSTASLFETIEWIGSSVNKGLCLVRASMFAIGGVNSVFVEWIALTRYGIVLWRQGINSAYYTCPMSCEFEGLREKKSLDFNHEAELLYCS
jgi:hypothetical protein